MRVGAGEGSAGDDAGADYVLGMGKLDLARHIGSRREVGDGGLGKRNAEPRQLLAPSRRRSGGKVGQERDDREAS
jgi:hypothetical protein